MKNKKLESLFEALGLRETARCFDEIAEESAQESLTYEEFMEELLGREVEVKTHQKVQRMLKDSTLDTRKTMDSFEKKRLNKRLRGQVENLLRGDFLKRTENVLAFGNPGSGKTHLLSAIAQELVSQGHKVLFRTCEKMVEDLLLQKQNLNLSAYLKKLNRYELLFLDDIGYVQKSREEMEVLFSLLAYRYERGSVMVTSNLVFSKWEQIFKDPMTTAAVIDRMVHHSVIMDMNLSSYRADEAKEQGD